MRFRSLVSARSAEMPFANYVIVLMTTGVFAAQMLLDPNAQYLTGLVLERCSLQGLLGHIWLHMTMVHLVGNIVTLWIFGRYVCPRLGGLMYAISYVMVGMAAGLVHLMYDGRPVIGASGAIMGVLGMHVVICFRRFSGLGPWLILAWFLATLGAGIVGGFQASYMAHIGGFLSGMILAACLVLCRIVKNAPEDRQDESHRPHPKDAFQCA